MNDHGRIPGGTNGSALARAMRSAAARSTKKPAIEKYPADPADKREAPRPDRPHPHWVKRRWRDSSVE